MVKSFKDIIKDLPLNIEPWVSMKEPNQIIPFHEGEFKLVTGNQTIDCEGSIYFKWFPSLQTFVEMTWVSDVHAILNPDFRPNLHIDDIDCGRLIVNGVTLNDEVKVTGVMNGLSVIGDKTVPVEKVEFVVPNLKFLFGGKVKNSSEDHSRYSRLNLKDSDFNIVIDSLREFDPLFKKLKHNGGYMILHAGEIIPVNGSLRHSEIEGVIECLQAFFSFLNGRVTSPIFLRGVFKNDDLWTDTTSYLVSPYKHVVSWTPAHTIEGIEELWPNFRKIFSDENKAGVLSMAIRWYLNANSNEGLSGNSIICAQVALELLYNWIVVEERRLITGRDSESISASNKIRLLVSLVNADSKSLINLKALDAFVAKSQDIEDRIDALVLIRNSVVHGQSDRVKRYLDIDRFVLHEVKTLAIWYIETALLFILGFNGQYFNRCSGAKWKGDGEEKFQSKW